MKRVCLALVVLVGCVSSNDQPDLDPTGTISTQMTWGGGSCRKTGTVPFMLHLAKNAYGSYDMTQNMPGAFVGGNVRCGSASCEIDFFIQWQGENYESYQQDGLLMLDGDTMQVTGNGKYSMSNPGTSCEQLIGYAGTLQ
jgi:hypothetical protein